MRRTDRRTWAALSALVVMLLLFPGCESGDVNLLACVFGDRAACDALLNPPPPPPPPVEGQPAAPTGLTAELSGDDVFLDWANNAETDVRRYNVYQATYNRTSGLSYNTLAGGVAASEFVDSFPHLDGTTYFWLVTAVDVDGNESARSEPVSLVYCGPSRVCSSLPGPPAAPTGLTVFSQDADGIGLDWTAPAEPDLQNYLVYRTTTPGQYGEALFSLTEHDTEVVVSASFYGLVPHTTYYFAVSAVDGDGEGREGPRSAEVRVFYCPATVAGCPAAPPATSGLRVVARDATGISLDWDDNGAARYVVFDDVVGRSERRVAYTTESSFRHAAPEETDHEYVVAALDADGRLGPRSNVLEVEWCGTANPTCATGPRAPTGLTATRGPFQVELDWNDNTETDLRGYDVWMAQAEGGPFATVGSLVTVSQRTVFDLPANSVWFFRVTAVDTAGRVSPPSAVVSCGEICTGASTPGNVRLRPAALASGPKTFRFDLTVSGTLGPGGTTRRDGDRVLGSGFRHTGTFALDRARKGLDPELSQLAAAGGTWSARFDWSITPGATATKSGIALATFADPALGKACLRLDEVSTVKKHGTTRRIVTSGVFTFLGGSAEAATLLGGATYDVEARPDGSLLYSGQGRPVPGGGPPLPAECAALAAS